MGPTALLKQRRAVALLACTLAGCAPSSSTPGTIGAPPLGVTQLAEQLRARGGMVVVAETVSMSEPTTSSFATGYTGVFLAHDEAAFTVRVTDSLGERVAEGTLLQVEAAISPEEVVDARGVPRTDWFVSGGSPLTVQLPRSSGPYVLYLQHTPRGTERSRWVAGLDDSMVDGESMQDPTDESVESLRREPTSGL